MGMKIHKIPSVNKLKITLHTLKDNIDPNISLSILLETNEGKRLVPLNHQDKVSQDIMPT